MRWSSLRTAPVMGLAMLQLCGPMANAEEAAPPHRQSQSQPPLNVETRVEIGAPMVSASYRMVRGRDAIVLSHDASGHSPGAKLTIKAGQLLAQQTNGRGTYFESADPVALKTFGVTQPHISGGVFIPDDPKKGPTLWWSDNGSSHVEAATDDLQFERKSVEVAISTPFAQELVYSGVSQGSISLLYREFKADLARPAFTQELHYDLASGDEIGFHGARIKVLKATNVDVRFIVTKPLADQ